ncbi:MAG: isoprenylcysteine carboxylmethyltransferase family protein [Bacteroidota bacterium]
MTDDGIYRIVFVALLVMLLAMRVYFMWKVRRTGGRIMPGKDAVAREGGRLVLAVRVLGFFLLMAFLGMYIAGMAWIDRLSFSLPDWLRWAGAGLGLLSVIFWAWTQVTLDTQWSAQLQLTKGHHLVTTGPYSLIRHPLYSGMCGWAAALALLTANWIFAGVAVLCVLAVFWRIPREERMMLEAFGGEYGSYMRRTGRLLPRLRGEINL